MRPRTKVLLVEDNLTDAQVLQEAFNEDPDPVFEFFHAPHLAGGLKRLRDGGIELILLDLHLPDSQGLATIDHIRSQASQIPIIILTSSDDDALAMQALEHGAEDYLVKGYVQVYPNLLRRSLRYALERKRAEEQVRQAHAKTERLLSSITSVLIGVSADGVVTHWNQIAEVVFGISSDHVLRRSFAECGIRWDMGRALDRVAACRQQDVKIHVDDLTFMRPDGRQGFLGVWFIPIREEDGSRSVLLFASDITERRQAEAERLRLQEELAQAQRMETIGRFAGGIAHDFNNYLQVILGFAGLVRSRHEQEPQIAADLHEVIHAAESASEMVQQLLAFSRRNPLHPKVFDLNRALEQLRRLVQQFVGEPIVVRLELADQPLMVKLDPTSFEQMIMNLCSNARDSMRSGGTLTIRTERFFMDERFRASHAWARVGDFIHLAIQDTGTGMDPVVAAKIFEPFFTTKQLGRGTGLGLAVVYGLVKQHDALIDVETAPGRGTTFHLYVPYPGLIAEPAAEPAARQAIAPHRGTEGVLIIDADDRQRALAEEVLRGGGYQAAAVGQDTAALAWLQQHPGDVAAVVLDTSQQPRRPQDIVERIRASFPQLKILIVSGYLDTSIRRLEASLAGVKVLQKPYVPVQLLEALRLVLDRPAGFEAAGQEPSDGGRSRVLIVDDDSAVRLLCVRMLQSRYETSTVPSAQIALEALGQACYDLLLTDIRMPAMDGFDLVEAAEKLRPGLKALLMTGSLTSEVQARMKHFTPRYEVLHKPFTERMLREAIARSLGAAGEGS